MKMTKFQSDRGYWWSFWATTIVLLGFLFFTMAYLSIGFDRTYLYVSGGGGVLYTVCLVASYSRTLLGEYHYFVWEPDGQVKKWDNGIEPTDFFAFGIPAYGIGLKPVVLIPKRGKDGSVSARPSRDGWSLRILDNGGLMLRDREGAQQRFVFDGSRNSREIENATEVLAMLRDAYWADTSLADKDNHGTFWWAMSRRESRYWDVMRDRTLLADAFALVAGRLVKCTAPGRFADAVKSPTGAWALSFTRRVLAWTLPTDDARRNTLAIVERLPGARETVRLEVEAGPDGPLPRRLPAERAEAPSGADSSSGA